MDKSHCRTSKIEEYGRMEKPIKLTKKHVKKAAQVCRDAFKNNPLWVNITPDEKVRETKVIALWEFFIRYGIKYGQAFGTSENVEGVSVWLNSNDTDMTLFKQLKCGGFKILRKLGLKTINKLDHIESVMSEKHKKIAPLEHLYLAQFAVDPKSQGNGFSSMLMRDMLERTNLPIYLETGKEINVSIYKHFGFELIEEVVIPDTDILMYCMLKK